MSQELAKTDDNKFSPENFISNKLSIKPYQLRRWKNY